MEYNSYPEVKLSTTMFFSCGQTSKFPLKGLQFAWENLCECQNIRTWGIARLESSSFLLFRSRG
jgi:hypothetical protein